MKLREKWAKRRITLLQNIGKIYKTSPLLRWSPSVLKKAFPELQYSQFKGNTCVEDRLSKWLLSSSSWWRLSTTHHFEPAITMWTIVIAPDVAASPHIKSSSSLTFFGKSSTFLMWCSAHLWVANALRQWNYGNQQHVMRPTHLNFGGGWRVRWFIGKSRPFKIWHLDLSLVASNRVWSVLLQRRSPLRSLHNLATA